MWLRRPIELTAEQVREPLYWCVHHDEDLQVFVDGELALARSGYTTSYQYVPVDEPTRRRLAGARVLAVHCKQTGGGQYVDVGLVQLRR